MSYDELHKVLMLILLLILHSNILIPLSEADELLFQSVFAEWCWASSVCKIMFHARNYCK